MWATYNWIHVLEDARERHSIIVPYILLISVHSLEHFVCFIGRICSILWLLFVLGSVIC